MLLPGRARRAGKARTPYSCPRAKKLFSFLDFVFCHRSAVSLLGLFNAPNICYHFCWSGHPVATNFCARQSDAFAEPFERRDALGSRNESSEAFRSWTLL